MAKEYEVTTGKKVISWIAGKLTRLGVGPSVVLTTTGRKSGQPREVVVSPIVEDGTRYLVSPYGESAWVLNARANSQVTISKGGTESPVHLVEVTGEKPELLKEYYEREGFARQFMDVPGEATTEAFASVPGRFPVFRVEE